MSAKFLSIKKCAELLEVSHWTVRKWIYSGDLASYKFKGTIRIKESDLQSLADYTSTLSSEVDRAVDKIKKTII